MKKLILLLLVCSCTFSLYAQEMSDSTQNGKMKIKTDDSKTKIKDNKAKTKDQDGKMKIKDNRDNSDMSTDGEVKTKIKDNKVKVKDADGKVKIKSENNLNTSTSSSGMGTMNTSTNTNVVVIGGWRTDPANLPVVGNNVPTDVVNTLRNKYGSTVYDIKQIRSTSGQNIYVVRVMGNGGMRTEYVGADGNVVSQ